MALPPRVYFTLIEVAVRWNCSIADLAAWASVGRLHIVTAIAPVTHGLQTVAGYVVVSVTDILHMFRRTGSSQSSGILKRVRPANQEDWIHFADPAHHIPVTVDDLFIMADDVQRFEADWDLERRPGAYIGSIPRYDWDGMYVAMMKRINDQGLPATQAEWVGEVQEWFIANSESGDAPDERTIRRRITPVWRALRGS
jgi:hypothetical protein